MGSPATAGKLKKSRVPTISGTSTTAGTQGTMEHQYPDSKIVTTAIAETLAVSGTPGSKQQRKEHKSGPIAAQTTGTAGDANNSSDGDTRRRRMLTTV